MAALVQRKVPLTLTAMNSSHRSTSMSSMATGGMFEPTAALLTRMSSLPNFLSVSAIIAPTALALPTSASRGWAVPPAAAISAATEPQSLASARTTLAPSAAKALANTDPSAAFWPAAAPVTIATFPSRRGMGFPLGLLFWKFASAQSGLHHQRVGDVLEFPHPRLEARPRQQHAVETHGRKHFQAVDHLLLGADQRIAAPAGD